VGKKGLASRWRLGQGKKRGRERGDKAAHPILNARKKKKPFWHPLSARSKKAWWVFSVINEYKGAGNPEGERGRPTFPPSKGEEKAVTKGASVVVTPKEKIPCISVQKKEKGNGDASGKKKKEKIRWTVRGKRVHVMTTARQS